MSHIQVIFELHDHFRYLESFVPNKTAFNKYCLTQGISKLPRSFEIHWIRQYMYLVNFTGLAGIVRATVYNTEPIFTGLRYGKLS